ncbi:hypothetical protein H632_c1520p0 [Helicosporidium sp. ATCC 50920]|nr:hypothetical protein H632_c1520p0 [Helicosporidium sp. ATCC 50920]|eukprot:KDD74161.1 hypothetical protein H632_c1520p0 [Helicosporidium sp. ATCC 50920]
MTLHDEVEIEDMEWSEELQAFTHYCPCGDLFQITIDELASGEEIARCPSCSLYVRVIYNPEDFQEQGEGAEDPPPLHFCGTARPFFEPGRNATTCWINSVVLSGLEPEARYAYRCGMLLERESETPPLRRASLHAFPSRGAFGVPGAEAGGAAEDELEAADSLEWVWDRWRSLRGPLLPSRTAPEPRATRLLLFGDMGVANAPAFLDMVALSRSLDAADTPLHAALHMGDLGYDLAELQGSRASQFLNMAEPLSDAVPYMAAAGNHESHFSFSHLEKLYAMPGGWARKARAGRDSPDSAKPDAPASGPLLTYSVDVGLVHVLVYNTEVFFWPGTYSRAEMRAMQAWMDADLAAADANRAAVPWVVVVGHRPMYCVVASAAGLCSEEHEASRRGLPSVCPHNNPRACRRARAADALAYDPEGGLWLSEEELGAGAESGEQVGVGKGEQVGGGKGGKARGGGEKGTGAGVLRTSAPVDEAAPEEPMEEETMEDLLFKHRVDLAVYGHIHCYARSWPVFNKTVVGAQGGAGRPGDVLINPRAPVHVTSGAGGNREMTQGQLPPPVGPCNTTKAPWCAFQSGYYPREGRSADHSFSFVTAHNATHLHWEQRSNTLGAVVDEWWVVQEARAA